MFTQTMHRMGVASTPPPHVGARQVARKEPQQARRDAQKQAQPAAAAAQKKKKTPGARGKNWTYPEKLCGVYAVTAVNAQFCDGSPQKERYVHYNDVYGKEAKRMWKNGEWVDQHGMAEDKISPEQSILERCQPITTATKSSPISTMVEGVIREVRNHLSPQLAKLLDATGHIRTGEQPADVKEKLRLVYFDILNVQKIAAAGKRASKTKGDAGHSSTSESEKEEEVDNPQDHSQEAADNQLDAAKLQAAKDRFHPDDFYLYLHFGPAVIGGSNNIAFLRDAQAMQEAVAKNGGAGRAKHRLERQNEMEGGARAAKAQKADTTLSQKLLGTPGSYSTPSPLHSGAGGAGAKTSFYFLAEQKAKMDKKWQEHDRLLGRMVLSPTSPRSLHFVGALQCELLLSDMVCDRLPPRSSSSMRATTKRGRSSSTSTASCSTRCSQSTTSSRISMTTLTLTRQCSSTSPRGMQDGKRIEVSRGRAWEGEGRREGGLENIFTE